ncbi:hypothetical protein CSUI_010092, partial [Cystoisospora suis]
MSHSAFGTLSSTGLLRPPPLGNTPSVSPAWSTISPFRAYLSGPGSVGLG